MKHSIKILVLGLVFSLLPLDQTYAQIETTVEDQHSEKSEIIKNVEEQLKLVFGEYYEQYGVPNIAMYTAFYERCEFVSIDEITSDIVNISTLDLIDKYNPEKINHDNLQLFKPEKFNVLKYRLEYYSNNDQYYRIYDTDQVLKINKLN